MSTLSTTLEENPIWSLSAACSFPDCPIVRRKDLELEQAKQEKQQLTEENERLRALLNKRNSAVFGRSSEKQPENLKLFNKQIFPKAPVIVPRLKAGSEAPESAIRGMDAKSPTFPKSQ